MDVAKCYYFLCCIYTSVCLYNEVWTSSDGLRLDRLAVMACATAVLALGFWLLPNEAKRRASSERERHDKIN